MFLNLTPHAIVIKNGDINVTVEPSGMLARVATSEVAAGTCGGIPVIRRAMGEVSFGDLARDQITPDTILLVSSMVLDALSADHELARNCFAPDTGQTAERNEKGHIVSVSRLVGK